MTSYTGQTRTTLSHLCATLWNSQSWPVVIKHDLTRVCCLREVQKALSRARSLYERWEELLEEGTQVHTGHTRLLTAFLLECVQPQHVKQQLGMCAATACITTA